MKLKQKNLWSGEEKNLGAPTGGRGEIFPGGVREWTNFQLVRGWGNAPPFPPVGKTLQNGYITLQVMCSLVE